MIFGSKHYTPNFFFKKNRSTDAHANIDKEKKIDANVAAKYRQQGRGCPNCLASAT